MTKIMSPIERAALNYIDQDLYLMPTKPDKTPACRHGAKDGSKDPNRVHDWFSGHPEYGIGIVCGPSQLICIDIDNKHGVDGWISWIGLMVDSSDAWTSQTPNGYHFIYALPEDEEGIGPSVGKLAPGIDIRAGNSYFIAPPTISRAGRYCWLNDWNDWPGTIPLPLLEHLRKSIRPVPTKFEPLTGPNIDIGERWLAYYLKKAKPGRRNWVGYCLAIQLHAEGYSYSEAAHYLLRYAAGVPVVPEDPYTIYEALASLRSAYGQPALERIKWHG